MVSLSGRYDHGTCVPCTVNNLSIGRTVGNLKARLIYPSMQIGSPSVDDWSESLYFVLLYGHRHPNVSKERILAQPDANDESR